MSVGVLHHACEDDFEGRPDQTEHVVLCKCACHHNVYVVDAQVKQVSFSVIRSLVTFDPNSFIPDAEPSGIFRPPKHIV